MIQYYKCVKCHRDWAHNIGMCSCAGKLKPVVKLRAIHSGDVDRELGYRAVFVPSFIKRTGPTAVLLQDLIRLQNHDKT